MFYAGVPLWVVILSGVAYVIGMGGAIYFGIGVATMLRPRVTARIANTAGIEDARQIDQADPISLRELGRRRVLGPEHALRLVVGADVVDLLLRAKGAEAIEERARDLKRSRRITLQEWQRRPWTDKVLDFAADLLSSQL